MDAADRGQSGSRTPLAVELEAPGIVRTLEKLNGPGNCKSSAANRCRKPIPANAFGTSPWKPLHSCATTKPRRPISLRQSTDRRRGIPGTHRRCFRSPTQSFVAPRILADAKLDRRFFSLVRPSGQLDPGLAALISAALSMTALKSLSRSLMDSAFSVKSPRTWMVGIVRFLNSGCGFISPRVAESGQSAIDPIVDASQLLDAPESCHGRLERSRAYD